MSRVELESVTKTYALDRRESARSFGRMLFGGKKPPAGQGIKVAVDGVSLAIGSGERMGIIGPNGAGKSTLLQLVAGISAPDAGILRIDGHVTSVLTLGVGIQDDATGRENIYLDGEIQGKTRMQIDGVLAAIVEFAELGAFIDRPVRTYSTGMKARLAFAMVTHIDPDILLIDETLSVGDAAFAAKASRRIREICAKGNIVVVVSHSLTAINEICDRCIWLEDGRIAMDGPAQEVTHAYEIAVRERDERELARPPHWLSGATELIAGHAIRSLFVSPAGRAAVGGAFRVGEPLTVRFVVRRPPRAAGSLALRLIVERLDGLVLVDERERLDGIAMEVELPGMLAAGTYRLGVELLADGEPAARRSEVFELAADRAHPGGRPALACPYSIQVEASRG